MECTQELQSILAAGDSYAYKQPPSHNSTDLIDSTNSSLGDLRSPSQMEISWSRYVDPKFVEKLQELADQLDVHAQCEEKALGLISELHEKMNLVDDDNLLALTELKKQVSQLWRELSYNELAVSGLLMMKEELIEMALYQSREPMAS